MHSSITNAQNERPTKSWAVPGWDSQYAGKPYVPFSAINTEGKLFTNTYCKGKVTFISFFFESCVGCRSEFSALNELYDSLKHDNNFQFIAITFDDVKSLSGFISKYNLLFPIATTGNHDIFSRLNYGMGCPSVILLDKNGNIALKGMKALTSENSDFDVASAISIIRKLE